MPTGGVPARDGGGGGGWGGEEYLPGYSSPREQNDRQVQKYYLAPNFVCGRLKYQNSVKYATLCILYVLSKFVDYSVNSTF